MFIKVEGTTLERDTKNMALLETDLKVKNDYLSKKKLLTENRKLKEEMQTLNARLEQIEKLLMKENK